MEQSFICDDKQLCISKQGKPAGIPNSALQVRLQIADVLKAIPPFSSNEGVFNADFLLPAAYHREKRLSKINKSDVNSIKEYMGYDLDVSRLNKIHKHLWLAGLPQISRPLHNQAMVGRRIVITERADLHLVWRDDIVHLKPLPDYLLSHCHWIQYLCTEGALFENAKGFLFSYSWLVCSKSDLRIAHEHGLISDAVDWDKWTNFCAAVISNIDLDELSDINPRYVYGELRLSRLNMICRFCTNTSSVLSKIRGYEYGYHQYSTFLERNFAWLLTVIVFITVVLTAMQVGLATRDLNEDPRFNHASYVFTIFSIFTPLAAFVLVAIVSLVLTVFNFRYALQRRADSHNNLSTVFHRESVKLYDH